MRWIEVMMQAKPETAELLAETLRPHGHGNGVALEQLGDPADLDPEALQPIVNVKIYVAQQADTAAFRLQMLAIASRFDLDPPIFRPLADIDWAEAWKIHYRPFPVGDRFWIRPSWETDSPIPYDRLVLTLDPGMAFGTGLHETTQLCLELLARYLQPGAQVLDLGTGSGILGIAAVLAGAERVVALDNDPTAVAAARENAQRNGVVGRIDLAVGSTGAAEDGAFDLILVNILAAVIIPMLHQEAVLKKGKRNGVYIFSGIIERQRTEFVQALFAAGGEVIEVARRGDWLAVVARSPKKNTSEC